MNNKNAKDYTTLAKPANGGGLPAMIAECELDLSDTGADETSALRGLADLLEYPTGPYNSTCNVEPFLAAVASLSLAELQELYTRTFDLNPICALEIGYHLFGENYKRGEFLAGLRETEAPFQLGQEQQLPDYLPVILRLLPNLDDEELRTTLIAECIIPALKKMLASFKDSENPYRYLLEAVRSILGSQVGLVSDANKTIAMNRRMSLPVLQPANRMN